MRLIFLWVESAPEYFKTSSRVPMVISPLSEHRYFLRCQNGYEIARTNKELITHCRYKSGVKSWVTKSDIFGGKIDKR